MFFRVLNCLGEGISGSVYKVKGLLDKKEYAIKRIPLHNTNPNEEGTAKKLSLLRFCLQIKGAIQYLNIKYELENLFFETLSLCECHTKWQIMEGCIRTKIDQLNASSIGYTSNSRELWALYNCEHENIIKMHTFFCEGAPSEVQKAQDKIWQDDINLKPLNSDYPVGDSLFLYIQMELCEWSLFQFLEKNNGINQTERKKKYKSILQQIVFGIEYLHRRGIVHGDLHVCEIQIFISSFII